MGAQHFHDAGRHIGDRVDAGVLERLRNHTGERAPVLHHVGNAGRVAEIVVLHGELAVGQSGHGDSAEVQERAAGCGHAESRPLEILAAEHGPLGKNAIEEDLFFRVDVLQEHLERAETLADSGGERIPFLRGENLGKQVAEPPAFAPRAFAVDVEGHAHLAHGRFESSIQSPHLVAREAVQTLEEFAIDFARLAVRTKVFVKGAEMPESAHAAAGWLARNSRAVSASCAICFRKASTESKRCSRRRKLFSRTSSSRL